ncbi:hypothetical protein Ssi03_10630 [Sphaerisporangium siamense]|uniref:histidine kinase n=1 Tax=Sphaerisporangium siamense TaxID=795645 RepID=A0A7W7GDG3_9ACTN|nr:nitrate- and nitrite sensing domain-containing protein [Sphaerisporangium siamense]MBB4705547.1 signal transduction histidine kinase [Sphaerisporangium siamense]GII83073.1 hypothetical protein Ssi03_10630 [Sphaerisporangium siamense]
MRTATIESGRRTEPDADRTPSTKDTAAAPRRTSGSRLALRNWRVRTRLLALILVPTTMAALLGGLRVVTSIQSATEYERVRTVAQFVTTLGDLAHQLDLERDVSVRFVANGRHGNQIRQLLRDQQSAVDGQIQLVLGHRSTVESALRDSGRQPFARLLDRLAQLRSLRQTVTDSQLPALPTLQKYSTAIDDVLAMFDETARGGTDSGLEASASALASLTRAAEQASRQRGLLSIGLIGGRFSPAELDAFNAARARQESELQAFFFRATLTEGQTYQDTVTGPKIDVAAAQIDRALELTRQNQPLAGLGNGADDVTGWFDASSERLDRMHDVQRTLSRAIVDRAAELAREDQRQAVVNIAAVVVLLLIVLAITAVMARSLVIPLRRLRGGALDIAGRRLPELVQKLRESDGTTGPPEVAPIGVMSNDEVGEVARAFDEVHREAVRLASDEAQLRSNVSAMFVNLSRRTQTLVERQITLIDGLEQGEQDDRRLGDLFRLDHLATRMRRNSENLLVLAGQEPARRWSQPVPLLDVARASLSEVENYERVAMNVPTGVSIVGQAVNDLIHLLAELVENAISFSPRETRVTLTANRIDGGGVMISITDAGIGMTPEELTQTNWRLANPPVVDVSVSRRMGLFVVGRLALRNGIRVQLRRHDSGGLTAMVLLPEALMGSAAGPAQGGASGQALAGAGASAWTGGQTGGSLFASASQGGAAFDAQAASLFGSPTGPFGGSNGTAGTGPLGPTTGGGFSGPSSGGFSGPASGNLGGFGETGAFGDTGSFGDTGAFGDTGSFGDTGAFGEPVAGTFDAPGRGPSAFGAPPAAATGAGEQAANLDAFGGPLSGGSAAGPSLFGGPSAGAYGGPPTGPAADPVPRPRSRRFDASDLDAVTGPLPAVRPSPMEQEEEFLPIFASVESAWFRRADPAQEEKEDTGVWRQNPADAGWQAAAVVKEPVRDGTTTAGLPKRVPKANLVPGSASAAEAATSPVPAMPALSPDRARSRLSSFQQGIRQGRAVARGEISEDEVAYGDPRRAQGDKEDK